MHEAAAKTLEAADDPLDHAAVSVGRGHQLTEPRGAANAALAQVCVGEPLEEPRRDVFIESLERAFGVLIQSTFESTYRLVVPEIDLSGAVCALPFVPGSKEGVLQHRQAIEPIAQFVER